MQRLISGLILGFLVLLGLILVGDIRQVGAEMIQFRWTFYPLVLLLTLGNYLLRFLKWHFYLGRLGIRDLPLLESARLFLAGFPLAVTPGKVGEALKAVWLQQETGLPLPKGIAVVMAERISDGLAVLLLSTLGVIAYPRYWPVFAGALVFVLTVIIISQVKPLALRLLTWSGKISFLERFSNSMRDFYLGSYQLFRPVPTLTAVGLGTVSWFSEGLGMYLILIGLGVSPGWNTLSLAVFVLAFSTVVGAVSALPGGLGAAEVSLAGMLTFLLGTEPEIASTATLLIRFATLWFAVAIGLGVWAFSRELLKVSPPSPAE